MRHNVDLAGTAKDVNVSLLIAAGSGRAHRRVLVLQSGFAHETTAPA